MNALIAIFHESLQLLRVDPVAQPEELVPGTGSPWFLRQNNIAGHWVAANVDLRSFEAEFGGKPHRLTAPVLEELGVLALVGERFAAALMATPFA